MYQVIYRVSRSIQSWLNFCKCLIVILKPATIIFVRQGTPLSYCRHAAGVYTFWLKQYRHVNCQQIVEILS